ncbi:MAG: D-alanyl-lipoteichoic acid biosynthesis protein DltD [Acidimicrobiales bacterium]
MAQHSVVRRPGWGRRFALSVLVTLLVVEGAARVVAPYLEPVGRWPRADYTGHEKGLAARAGDLDLLVLGSSVVGRDISPDRLRDIGGPAVGYNYWLAGPPMRSIDLLATDVVLQRVSPSVVLLGVTMREFVDGPSARAHLEALRQSPGFQAASGRLGWIDRLDDRLQQVSVLARHRTDFRDPVALVHNIQAEPLVPEQLGADGYLLDRGDDHLADEPAAHVAQEQAVMAGYEVNPADVDALRHLLEVLRDRGVEVLVVNLPVTERFIAMADDRRADYEAYLRQVRAAAEEGGAAWLDTMDRPWPDRLFADVNHLNNQGAARLQPLVLDALERLPAAG